MTDLTLRKMRLSEPQRALLATAAAQPDQIVSLPTGGARADGTAVRRALQRLLARGLVEEVPARPDDGIWRETEAGGPLALRLAEAGRAALGLESDNGPTRPEPPRPGPAPLRPGTKQARLAEMLGAPGGATLSVLSETLGWLPHTTRAAITELRKRGFQVAAVMDAEKRRVYSIVDGSEAGDAA